MASADSAAASVDSYFIALGDGRYMPTAHSGGAWRDDELHLAPVAGLLVHHMERWRRANADPSLVFSRFGFEVLGQIAREEIVLSTEVVRPGRTIELIETTAVIGGRTTIRARAWLLQQSDTSEIAGHEFVSLPAPESCLQASPLGDWSGGFIASVEARLAGEWRPGRARTWMRGRHALVSGETAEPLAEFAKMLDTANGVAVRESPERWMYPNVDLSLHLFRIPVGEWVGLDTRVAFGASGVGLTSSVMHDAQGPVGTIHQSTTLRRMPAR